MFQFFKGGAPQNIFKKASLDLNFALNKNLLSAKGESLVTFVRASSATYFDATGVMRTTVMNYVPNSNSMSAVVTGSPGTMPTGWYAQANSGGWTREIVGTGSIGALNYIDVRFSGTPSGGTFSTTFAAQGVMPAINGQTWAASIYHQIVAGSIGNVVGYPAANLWNSSLGYIGGLALSGTINPTASLQRYGGVATIATVGTAYISWGITFTCTAGQPYDFTLRFAGPQMELAAAVGDYVPTTGTANSTPRFDHNPLTGESLGLLVEEQRANLCLWGADFSNAVWVPNAATVTANTQTAPDGTVTADTFTPTLGTPSMHQQVTCLASTVYTWSFYVRLGTMAAADFRFAVRDDSNGAFIAVDIVPSITPVTTEWRRVTYTFTTPVGCVLVRPYVYRFAPTSYGTTLFIWGAQLEAGAFPTSYIPTTSAAVTRSPDQAFVTGSNFSSWYNQTEGTFYAAGTSTASGTANAVLVQVDDTTAAERLALRRGLTTDRLFVLVVDNGVTQASASITSPLFSGGIAGRATAAYALNDVNLAFNGVVGVADTSATLPTATQLQIGGGIGSLALNGSIRRIAYWPTRKTDAFLSKVTR